MPSPLAHVTMGYALYRFHRHAYSRQGQASGLDRRVLLAALGLSFLPDVDSALGLLTGEFARYHNNVSHSLAAGALAALAVGGLIWLRRRSGFGRWFALALASYWLHIAMDYFTSGRGVMALWPFSADRDAAPVSLFVGLHWSDGLLSVMHVWMLASELAFVVAVAVLLRLLLRTKGGGNERRFEPS